MVVAAVLAAAVTASASPSPAAPDGQVRVTVNGLSAPAASVHLRGGIASGGRWFGFVALRDSDGGSWFTILRAPGFLGVYPIVVRAGGVTHETGAVVTVLPRKWTAQPAFQKPEQVAQWWTRQAPPGANLTSVSTWQSGFFTHRDPALNRLLRVRFTLLGDWRAMRLKQGPHELFFSIARLKPTGAWRLLETVPAP
jgi:hypothetical protein